MNILIKDHQIGVDFWNSKRELFEKFYGAFYQFILEHGGKDDLESHNVKSVEDFYNYADWNAEGKDSCYAMGFSFHKYYLTPEEGGKIENQPESTFIGYCYHNNLFTDFLDFLITFFAWWRNDEGCTCFDPYNHADEFFNSSWAALVDTSKLFYLTSETVYHWQSFRVKYALDHIPGVILQHPTKENPKFWVAGYEFLGYIEEGGKQLANFKRKDNYKYWEVEEKKIHKVYVKDSCYAMGFSFHKYYLTPEEGGKIENQPESTFIGYCYHNNLFTDFLDFLITFFAWWRNDEGCTCFDPYNHADEFFNSSWAALVDTSKLFYLTSETVYHWQSFRVKYALDHIPGVILQHPTKENPKFWVAGYEFLGYIEEGGKQLANFKRKDNYKYWEVEEKKIHKVYVKDYKKVDPA